MNNFAARYGPWALVAGASEGIGAAFAHALADRGLDLVLVARRAEPLEELADRLPTRVVPVCADLATGGGLRAIQGATAAREIGLVVANAAYSPVGEFVDAEPAHLERAVALNCGAPLLLARHFLPAMAARGHGGMIMMSSLAGQQGSPGMATYAATKAFGTVLAEGLWAELRGRGVDVVACVAGAVAAADGDDAHRPRGAVAPEAVVSAALRGLGRGPRTVPGALARLSSTALARLLPRRTAITVVGRTAGRSTGPG